MIMFTCDLVFKEFPLCVVSITWVSVECLLQKLCCMSDKIACWSRWSIMFE